MALVEAWAMGLGRRGFGACRDNNILAGEVRRTECDKRFML